MIGEQSAVRALDCGKRIVLAEDNMPPEDLLCLWRLLGSCAWGHAWPPKSPSTALACPHQTLSQDGDSHL